MGAFGGVLRVVVHFHHLGLTLGVVVKDELDGVLDDADACGGGVEVLAHGVLQKLDVVQGFVFGVTDAVDEVLDAGGGVTAAAQSTQRGHSGIVPTGDKAFLDELEQLALAHDGVGEVEAVELDLTGAV